MGTCSTLATLLDQEMLEAKSGITILPRTTPDLDITYPIRMKTGAEVAKEMGGRYFLRYLLPHQVGLHTKKTGSHQQHWVTPTPYAPAETISWLALPGPTQSRPFVIVLDPSKIDKIWGPRWVRLGKGIEYILPDGFDYDAIVPPRYEIQVT